MKKNFYIITGGPGSGKTAIIEALKNRGFLCVDEVARKIIQEQTKIGGDAVHTKDQRKFLELMLSRSIHTFEQVAETEGAVFFDRGIPELIGYCRLIKVNIPDYLQNAINQFRYNSKVFITPPWKEIYQNDKERVQTWQEAVDTYRRVSHAYQEANYRLIDIPKETLLERVNFILGQVDRMKDSKKSLS